MLDMGAKGVMVPRVETGAQMRDIVAQLKYAPAGRRGVALGITHDRFRAADASYFARANDETVVIALCETVRAFDNLDDILATPGLDVAVDGTLRSDGVHGDPCAVRSSVVPGIDGPAGRSVPAFGYCRRISAGYPRRNCPLDPKGLPRNQPAK